jgi:hypothetical protein
LETLGAKYNSTWEERLPMIMLALRQTPRPPLNLSPAQIVYGRQVSGPAEVELNWDPLELTPVDSWIYQRLKIYRETRIELSEALNEQRLNRPQPGKSRPPAELQPGDLVLVFNPEALISETRGLRFKWKGPHVVHRRTGAVNYLIWEDGKLKVFHLSRIIPYDPSGLTEENPVLEQVKELRKEYQAFLRTLAAEMRLGKPIPRGPDLELDPNQFDPLSEAQAVSTRSWLRPLDQASEPLGMITDTLDRVPLEEKKADPPDPPTEGPALAPPTPPVIPPTLIPVAPVIPRPPAPTGKVGKKKSKTFQEEPEVVPPVEREGKLGIIRYQDKYYLAEDHSTTVQLYSSEGGGLHHSFVPLYRTFDGKRVKAGRQKPGDVIFPEEVSKRDVVVVLPFNLGLNRKKLNSEVQKELKLKAIALQ